MKWWVYPPYACTCKDGFLIGTGVQDNKGPVMAVFYALWYLKEQGFEPGIRIRQILGCQEEAGMTDVDAYLRIRRAPDYSVVRTVLFRCATGKRAFLRPRCLPRPCLAGSLNFPGER